MKLARLHRQASTEPYWHVYLAVAAAICLQLIPGNHLSLLPSYLTASLEGLLLLGLVLTSAGHSAFLRHLRRNLAIVFITIISLANLSSLVLIVHELLTGHQISGQELLLSSLAVYLTNVIIYGLWYWELDGNGQLDSSPAPTDFLFPQMSLDKPETKRWTPTFFDYLYLSITNASAFSPTDTLPLTHRAKLLMASQSLVSLVTVALVAARAVNILQ